MNEFTKAYIDCSLWTSLDEADVPFDRDRDVQSFSPETLEKMKADCAKFQADNHNDCWEPILDGHDFWLTRNRAGSGFWARHPQTKREERLTKAAHDFGEFNLYIGDDGKIYHH